MRGIMNITARPARKLFAICALAAIAACAYSPSPENGAQQCGPVGGKRCPSGYTCYARNNACYRDGELPAGDGGAGTTGAAGTSGTAGTAGGTAGTSATGGAGTIGNQGGAGSTAGTTGSGTGGAGTGGPCMPCIFDQSKIDQCCLG
jgi:hypothetical protein